MTNVFERALDVGEPKRLLISGAIAESGSIGAAARELAWSQFVQSQHVNALEKYLGVTLFERTPRGIVLSTAGQPTRICANEISASMTGMRGDLAKVFCLGGRNVLIAGFPGFVVAFLAPARGRLESAAARQPNVYAGGPVSNYELDTSLTTRASSNRWSPTDSESRSCREAPAVAHRWPASTRSCSAKRAPAESSR